MSESLTTTVGLRTGEKGTESEIERLMFVEEQRRADIEQWERMSQRHHSTTQLELPCGVWDSKGQFTKW
jgi:hypothetical protein